jgi:hypothetical protein
MSDHRYLPAADGWAVLCREGLVLGVDLATTSERLAVLWPLVRDGSGSAALLDELTRGGISAAPGFALFEESQGFWRVIARGSVLVEAPGSGVATIDAKGATAWVERDVPGTPTLVARAGEKAADGELLPIRGGVVVATVWEVGPENPAVRVSAAPVITEAAPIARDAAPAPIAPDVAEVPEHTLISQTVSGIEMPESVGAGVSAAPDGAGYDHLFGMTVVRKVEDAAVREPEEEASPTPLEDRTKVATGLAERRALRRAAKAAAEVEAGPAGPRHWLELSTGGREELEGTVIVGRAPSATRVSAGNIPRLVTFSTPNQDISRTHAQIVLEGDTVVVTDLHSSNGTFVAVPGRPPQKLRAGEPTPVVVDTVIDLGDGATLTVRVDS